MNRETAQTAVTLSAFWVAAIYAYRKLTEPITGTPTNPTAHFVIGFGFTYIVLSIVAQAAPAAGGMFAVLVAAGDTLVNGKPLLADVQTALKTTSPSSSSTRTVTNTAPVTVPGQHTSTIVGG